MIQKGDVIKKIVPLMLAVLLIGLAEQSANGCSCVVESENKKIDYKKWAKGFDGAAFKGRVERIETDEEKGEAKVVFFVDSFWRGVVSSEIVLYTPIDSGRCGVGYEVGKDYTVIADRTNERLWIYLCTDLQYQAHLKGYLKALGKASVPKPAAREAEDDDPQSRLVDEMGTGNCEDELARLDMLANEVRNNPGSFAYLIAYGGKEGKKDEAKARLARMSYYLSEIRGVPKPIIVDGGFREKMSVRLWLYYPGEFLPVPSPTVDAKDVKLKGAVKIRRYNCADEMGDH